jgi:hypothetical protein
MFSNIEEIALVSKSFLSKLVPEAGEENLARTIVEMVPLSFYIGPNSYVFYVGSSNELICAICWIL